MYNDSYIYKCSQLNTFVGDDYTLETQSIYNSLKIIDDEKLVPRIKTKREDFQCRRKKEKKIYCRMKINLTKLTFSSWTGLQEKKCYYLKKTKREGGEKKRNWYFLKNNWNSISILYVYKLRTKRTYKDFDEVVF